MQLHQLTYALAVAEERSFTRAADRLHLAQPSLSRQVRLLENELGVVLFNRGPGQGPVTLTADGADAPPVHAARARRRRGHGCRGPRPLGHGARSPRRRGHAEPDHERARPRARRSSTGATPASTSRSSRPARTSCCPRSPPARSTSPSSCCRSPTRSSSRRRSSTTRSSSPPRRDHPLRRPQRGQRPRPRPARPRHVPRGLRPARRHPRCVPRRRRRARTW